MPFAMTVVDMLAVHRSTSHSDPPLPGAVCVCACVKPKVSSLKIEKPAGGSERDKY